MSELQVGLMEILEDYPPPKGADEAVVTHQKSAKGSTEDRQKLWGEIEALRQAYSELEAEVLGIADAAPGMKLVTLLGRLHKLADELRSQDKPRGTEDFDAPPGLVSLLRSDRDHTYNALASTSQEMGQYMIELQDLRDDVKRIQGVFKEEGLNAGLDALNLLALAISQIEPIMPSKDDPLRRLEAYLADPKPAPAKPRFPPIHEEDDEHDHDH